MSLAGFARGLEGRVSGTRSPTLEDARDWLAFCGQLEQAARDADADVEAFAGATDAAAALLLDVRDGLSSEIARLRLQGRLDQLAARPSAHPASFRVPEGFAWYALYPESYAQTAETWADEEQNRNHTKVLVVGLRSIGTALGAIVAEALRRRGRTVHRIAPRPSGHPCSRQVLLTEAEFTGDAALVVDEGPGLSGSSMAAAADALTQRGYAAERIFLVPSHGNGPGAAGKGHVCRWWTADRVRVTPLRETRFSGHSLRNSLARAAELALGEEIAGVEETVFPATADLPHGVMPAFATPEIVCRGRSGDRVVWRFGGFAAVDASLLSRAERGQARQRRMADMELALMPVGRSEGWMGLRMPRAATSLHASGTDMVERLALYVAAASLATRDTALAEDGARRIATALAVWAEVSGVTLPSGLADRAIAETPLHLLAGDGRLAPHQWIALPGGAVVKSDATGADCRHDWAGAQSIVWDVAGAIVEWDLDDAATGRLTGVVERHTRLALGDVSLAFFTAGYACLRLAMARHCATLYPQGSPARTSLTRHAAHYERSFSEGLRQLTVVA